MDDQRSLSSAAGSVKPAAKREFHRADFGSGDAVARDDGPVRSGHRAWRFRRCC